MSILIKSAQVLDEHSPFHLQKVNILISESGVIKYIGPEQPASRRVVEGHNLKVSIGWFDMRANFSDPGFEHKEDLQSGCRAAASGGFTGVALLPNTKPVVESKNEIAYLKAGSASSVTQVFPYGAVTKGTLGEDLTEMLDMHSAGAVAFTDGEKPIWNTDILLKTLLYLQKFNGLLINRPEDPHLSAFGMMHEGPMSTSLGLKGLPRLAEELMVRRDIELLKYAGGRLHFANLSTAGSVELVRKAKKHGLNVTCDVAVYNLMWDDSALADYDTNLKVNPPLREASDIRALERGISEEHIDVIVSSHSPQDTESKRLEFDHAEFGMTALQTFYPIVLRKSGEELFLVYLRKFTQNPRLLLGLPMPIIREEEKANITVFDPDQEWVFDDKTNLSKSVNSPLFGKKLRGKVIAAINNGKSYIAS